LKNCFTLEIEFLSPMEDVLRYVLAPTAIKQITCKEQKKILIKFGQDQESPSAWQSTPPDRT